MCWIQIQIQTWQKDGACSDDKEEGEKKKLYFTDWGPEADKVYDLPSMTQ